MLAQTMTMAESAPGIATTPRARILRYIPARLYNMLTHSTQS